MTIWLDLHEICPHIHPVCTNDGYHDDEQKVIGPALEAAGYELRGSWFTGEGDSFGPLTRCIRTDKGTVVYG